MKKACFLFSELDSVPLITILK